VKTRLADRLAPHEAASLAGAFLADVVEGLQLLANSDVRVALPDGDPPGPVRRLLGAGVPILPQGPGDLGDRLARAIAAETARGAPAVAVVGADHPTLPAELVRRCLAEARARRAGWIPTEDGGFAALSVGRDAPGLFDAVPWSTGGVADAVRANARRIGLDLVDCGVWYDVDTPEDLDRLAAELARSPGGCAATRAVLRALDPPLRDRGDRAARTGGEP
jgi:glycosyltransferase A (GT-A) superfamily protein (DUF2064 family)